MQLKLKEGATMPQSSLGTEIVDGTKGIIYDKKNDSIHEHTFDKEDMEHMGVYFDNLIIEIYTKEDHDNIINMTDKKDLLLNTKSKLQFISNTCMKKLKSDVI